LIGLVRQGTDGPCRHGAAGTIVLASCGINPASEQAAAKAMRLCNLHIIKRMAIPVYACLLMARTASSPRRSGGSAIRAKPDAQAVPGRADEVIE
jgi:hypothetical protein